jgi:hypothetical protein
MGSDRRSWDIKKDFCQCSDDYYFMVKTNQSPPSTQSFTTVNNQQSLQNNNGSIETLPLQFPPFVTTIMPLLVCINAINMAKSHGSAPPDIPTEAGRGDDESTISSPLHFPPAEPFESKDDTKDPSAYMIVSESHHTERGTSSDLCQKIKYSGKKKSDSNKNHRQPSHALKKQTMAPGKRVFVERKVIKYRVKLDSPWYEVVQLYQSNKF